jgi:hypothetical protein
MRLGRTIKDEWELSFTHRSIVNNAQQSVHHSFTIFPTLSKNPRQYDIRLEILCVVHAKWCKEYAQHGLAIGTARE